MRKKLDQSTDVALTVAGLGSNMGKKKGKSRAVAAPPPPDFSSEAFPSLGGPAPAAAQAAEPPPSATSSSWSSLVGPAQTAEEALAVITAPARNPASVTMQPWTVSGTKKGGFPVAVEKRRHKTVTVLCTCVKRRVTEESPRQLAKSD